MSEIVDFLLARLAEDERVVRYASVNAHRPALHLDGNGYVVVDPTRVLAEVEAKRQIVALHQPGEMLDHYEFGCTCGFSDHRWAQCKGCGAILDDEGELDRGIRNRACPTLRLLALPYADHEHYRQEWRP